MTTTSAGSAENSDVSPGGTTSDPLGELLQCCDMLAEIVTEYADIAQHRELDTDEHLDVTLAYQTVELVGLLLQDTENAWLAVSELRGIINKLQADMASQKPELWTPHVTLPGQTDLSHSAG